MLTAINLTHLKSPSESSRLLAQLFKSYPNVVRFSKKKTYPIKLPDPNQPGKTIEYELKLSNPILVRDSVKYSGTKRYDILNEERSHRNWNRGGMLGKHLGEGTFAKVTPIIATLKVANDDAVICKTKKRVAKKIKVRTPKLAEAQVTENKEAVQNESEILKRVSDAHAKKPVFTSSQSENGECKEAAYIVMREAEGSTLFQLLKLNEITNFSFQKTIEMLISIAEAVQIKMHRTKIIHRDLKPENIFFNTQNGKTTIVDVGLARKSEIDDTGFAGGSLGYAPPEQCLGRKTGTWSDVFALGKTFKIMMDNFSLSEEDKQPIYGIITSMTKRKPQERATLDHCVEGLKALINLSPKKIVDQINKNYPAINIKTSPELHALKYQLATAVKNYLVQPKNSFWLFSSTNNTIETYRDTSERRLKNCSEILAIINYSKKVAKLIEDIHSYAQNRIDTGIETFDLGWGLGKSDLRDQLLQVINDYKSNFRLNTTSQKTQYSATK